MAQVTYTARQTARDVQAALAKVGVVREVDAKRVRAWVRDHLDAWDDDQYTTHLYSPAVHRTIVDGMTKRYTAGRPASASIGRTPSPKPAAKPAKPATRKPAPTARAMGSGPVARATKAAQAPTVAPSAPQAPEAGTNA